MYVRMYVCIYVCIMYVCTYVRMYILCIMYVCMYVLFFYLLIKHAPSLESNTTFCELVGNAGPAPIRLLSLHFLYIVSVRLYIVLSLALLLL